MAWRGWSSTVCYTSIKIPVTGTTMYFLPPCVTLPQKKTSFFNLSLCSTSALQAGPICSTELCGDTSTAPLEGGRGTLGSKHPWVLARDAQASRCFHIATLSPSCQRAGCWPAQSHQNNWFLILSSDSLQNLSISSICIHFTAWVS